MKKTDEILLTCYQELYANSEPKADFNELMDKASINEFGQKVIDYMAYEIDENLFEEIIQGVFKKYKLNKHNKELFKRSIYLGCSPKFKK